MKACGIYCLTNTITGKRYVGQSINIESRLRCHRRVTSQYTGLLQRSLLKHGPSCFDVRILATCDRDSLDEMERFWIDRLNTLVPGGYNLDSGGTAGRVVSGETKQKLSIIAKSRPPMSVETKRKIAAAGVGRTPTAETRKKLTAAQYARGPMLDETKAKISMARTGAVQSAETIEKKIASNVGKKRSIEVLLRFAISQMKGKLVKCSNGKTYASILEAHLDTGISKSKVRASCRRESSCPRGIAFRFETPQL